MRACESARMVGMRSSSRPVLVLAVLLGGLLAHGAPATATTASDSGSTAACTAEDVVVVVEEW